MSIKWPELKIPPLNLWNIWRSPEMEKVDKELGIDRARYYGERYEFRNLYRKSKEEDI